MKYYLIAGEASGDLHASHLMRAIKRQDPAAEFRFFGGDAMQEAGGTLVLHYREMAFMGFFAVAMNLRAVLRNLKLCKEDIRQFKPDVVIPVDYPGFNLKIAKFVHDELKIPVYYYIAPKIWAWKEGRIKQIKAYVDRIFSILPFEQEFFRKHDYEVDYVGNPSLDEVDQFLGRANREGLGIRREKPIIALLCGSRRDEIKDNLPQMLEAVKAFPKHQPIIAGAPGIDPSFYDTFIRGSQTEVVFGQTFPLLHSASAALVTSGTATLETALFGVPQAVCYYLGGGKVYYKIIEKMLKIRFVSLVNLIADREVVREILGYKATAENLRAELDRILNDPDYRKKMSEGYEEIRERLGKPGAPEEAARRVVRYMKNETN